MQNHILDKLNEAFNKCSDCLLHPEYISLLTILNDSELSQDLVDFLCEKTTSKKLFWELRFEHLKILLLNHSAHHFDLKDFFLDNFKKSRRLTMKLFFLRGYALYATEAEVEPLVNKFCENLKNNHDYIDYEAILSVAGLPYLVKEYMYPCFVSAYHIATEEYQKIHPLLRGYFTLDEKLNQVNLLSYEEVMERSSQLKEAGNQFLGGD